MEPEARAGKVALGAEAARAALEARADKGERAAEAAREARAGKWVWADKEAGIFASL